MHGSPVVRKIIGHRNDLSFDFLFICAFFCYHEAFSCVLLSGLKLGKFAFAHPFNGIFQGNSVLFGVFHTRNPPYGIRMALTDSLAPEGIACSLGQDRIAVYPQEGEQSGIPTHRDQRKMPGCLGRSADLLKIFGDFGMGIKAVHRVAIFGQFRRLHGKIVGRTAAKNQNIQFLRLATHFIQPEYRHIFAPYLKSFRVPPCENGA